MATFEIIEPAIIVDDTNSQVDTIGVGETINGDPIEIDGDLYVQLSNNTFVKMSSLSESKPSKMDLNPENKSIVEKTVKASHQKMIFALSGGLVGYAVGHFTKATIKKKVIYTVLGIIAGLLAEKIKNRKTK